MTPLRVGEIARTVGVAQSTASVHLRRLLDDEFVIVERSANSSWYRINAECLEQFPRAAAQVMGTLAGTATTPDALGSGPVATTHRRAGGAGVTNRPGPFSVRPGSRLASYDTCDDEDHAS